MPSLPTLVFLALLLTALAARADDRPAWQAELAQLATKGKTEQRACDELEARFDRIATSDVEFHGKGHPTKAEAMRVLSALERSPVWAPSWAAARDLFAEHRAEVQRALGPASVLDVFDLIGNECLPTKKMIHAAQLLQDLHRFAFAKEEAERVRGYVKAFVAAERPFRTLLGGLVRGELLYKLVEEAAPLAERTERLAKVKAMNDLFQSRREELNEQWSRRSRDAGISRDRRRALNAVEEAELLASLEPIYLGVLKDVLP